MAYSWQTEPNRTEPQEDGSDTQQFHHTNQHLSSSQVRLGFDQLVEEINNKTPLSESEKEEDTYFVPDAPNLGSKWPSIYETHPRYFSEFTSQSPDSSQLRFGKLSAIGFNPAVLPTHQLIHEGASWRNPSGKYHGIEYPRFDALPPSSTGQGECNPQGQSGTKHHNYCGEHEGNLPHHHSSYSIDSIPNREKRRSGDVNLVEPSLEFSKDSFLPRTSENVSVESTEPIGCPIEIVEVPQGSNKNLASFCNKVKKIRESYHASDINSNSGKIWAITTAYPSRLFADTKFRVKISIDNSAQLLLLMPHANYLVKDLIAEILLLCANEPLSPKEYLLSVCGSEEFLQIINYPELLPPTSLDDNHQEIKQLDAKTP